MDTPAQFPTTHGPASPTEFRFTSVVLKPVHYVGVPCRNCGSMVRYKCNGRCVACLTASNYAPHVKARKREWERRKAEKKRLIPLELRAEEMRRTREAVKARRWKHKDRWNSNKRSAPPEKKIVWNLRTRVWKALKLNQATKSETTLSLIGCSVEELRCYIASLFRPGMSWENYGQWELDHKRPCASFDLTDPNQQKICFHYSNLQPLWRTENRVKNKRILTVLPA